MSAKPLIVHLIYRLGMGGLENGLVNLVNHMPAYRHAIVTLKPGNDFSLRLNTEVSVHCIDKAEGQDWPSFARFHQVLRRLKPAIVHTRNLATIEYQVSAALAGVKRRVHGEHGWDVFDPDGNNKKYQWERRLLAPGIDRSVPLSRHLENYLRDKARVSPKKIVRIINGVDTDKFFPRVGHRPVPLDCPLTLSNDDIVVGTIGRMHGVKDQISLVKAFIEACQRAESGLRARMKLAVIGDGPLREPALELLARHNLSGQAWLPGQRGDNAELLRGMDLFVLPSQAEGISNTILEAMATGLPVLATDVGGNPELVADGVTGMLVAANDAEAMAEKILRYLRHPGIMSGHGEKGRQRALAEFSLSAMVARYQAVYDSLIEQD